MIKEAFDKYFLDVIKNHYVDFFGKATPKQFWLFYVWSLISGNILYLICDIIFPSKIQIIFATLYWLVLFLPYLAIELRRFRDAGIPLIWFIALIALNMLGLIILVVSVSIMLFNSTDVSSVPLDNIVMLVFGLLLFLFSSIATLIICILPSKQTQPEKLN